MRSPISPSDVHGVLGERILLSGMELVFDLRRSHGNYLHDSRTGRDFLDMFTFFGSRALAFDHPALIDPTFRERLGWVATAKPSNCDTYTVEYAEFMRAFAETAGRGFPHAFVVSGGALAVENALKCAFDWKVRKNLAAGRGPLGGQVIHFEKSFHGRSGYTLSITDSPDPRKTLHYPQFDWPRIESPAASFPLTGDNLATTERAEARALAAVGAALDEREHDVAAIILEPIQAEGGDRHLRPAFLSSLREIADEREVLLVFDEVQTGLGLTGAWWAHERLGVKPDLVAFGKKFQVCGFAATERIDDVENVFKVPSRISTTFEGNWVDMVRAARILQVVEADGLLAHAAAEGEWLLEQLQGLELARESVTNARGLGLMAAIDLPTEAERDDAIARAAAEGLLILGCGERSIRFRPSLDVTRAELEQALDILGRSLGA